MPDKDKDIAGKNFIGTNEIFADILSTCLDLEEIHPEDLTDYDTHSFSQSQNRLRALERDVFKIWKAPGGEKFAIGIEIQSRPDFTRPARVIRYDAAEYDRQAVSVAEARKRRRGGQVRSASANSQMPVVTYVLYLGTKPWKAPLDIAGQFHVTERYAAAFGLSEKHIHLIDAGGLSAQVINKMKSDFRYIIMFLKSARKHEQFVPDATMELRHPIKFGLFLAALQGIKMDENRLQELLNNVDEDERTVMTMLSLLSPEERKSIYNTAWDKAAEATLKEAGRLYSWLIQSGRLDDALKAAKDKAEFDRLFAQMEKSTAQNGSGKV